MIVPIKFNAAGLSFRLKEAATVVVGDRLDLVPDPTNKFDPNAIKLLKGDVHIGYVPKAQIDEVKDWMAAAFVAKKTYACVVEYVWRHHTGVGITAVMVPGADMEPPKPKPAVKPQNLVVERLGLEGLLLIKPQVYSDPRGYFMEMWSEQLYLSKGISAKFVQDNVSMTGRCCLRGLHYQKPGTQGKLITVLDGEVYDVVVDIRCGSTTFGMHYGVELSSSNCQQLYVPPGFAHGFLALSETAIVHYKCTEYYAPGQDYGLRWDDPALGIDWPFGPKVLSQKDKEAPLLKDIPLEDLL